VVSRQGTRRPRLDLRFARRAIARSEGLYHWTTCYSSHRQPSQLTPIDGLKVQRRLRADNDANAFSARFSGPETAVTVRGHEGQAEQVILALASYGWGSAMRPAGSVTQLLASGKRLDRHYGPGLSEWFLNAPQGLEQGFAIAQVK
jgi:hypothetical protein